MASSFSPNVVTGPRLHALLWQQVARADSSAERMRWIEIAFEHGRKKGMAFAMAEALADPLSSVEASVSLGGYADSAGTIHLVNGHPAQAVAWQEAARLAADAGNADAQRAFSALSPLLFISSHDEATFYTPARLSEWWDQYEDTAPSIRLRQGDRLFTRLSDLGVDVPQTLLDAVLAAPAVTTTAPPAVLWRQLLQAIHHDRLGETVLTGLAAMDDKGLAYTHPALLSAIITGLRLTGLEEDARNLALETMIMDGF